MVVVEFDYRGPYERHPRSEFPSWAVVNMQMQTYEAYKAAGYAGLGQAAGADELVRSLVARIDALHAAVQTAGPALSQLWHELAECEGRFYCNIAVIGPLLCDDCERLRSIVEAADAAFQEYLQKYRELKATLRQSGLGFPWVAVLFAAAAVLWAFSKVVEAFKPSDAARLAEALRQRNEEVYRLTMTILSALQSGAVSAQEAEAILRQLQGMFNVDLPKPDGLGGLPVWAWILIGIGVLILAAAVRMRTARFGRREVTA